MGNQHSLTHPGSKPRKNVHWKTAEKPGSPGKPEIIPLGSEEEPNAVTLRWSQPKHDGGAPLVGYQVECNRIGSTAWIHTSPPVINKPELILTGLEGGYRYQFRICAVNAVGHSEPSELSDILTISSDKSAFTAPKFLTHLTDATVLENETSSFRATFDGVPPPTIAWFKDGFEIFSSRRTAITTDDNSSVLTFHQTLLSDEGELKCTATNRAGHAVTRARLSLHAPPKLRYPRQYEDGLLYEVNETIFLKTSVVGKPAPEVEWLHDGKPVTPDERHEITNTPKLSALRIRAAQRQDRGEYQVRARNTIGEDSAAFLVTVTAPPEPPQRLTVSRQVDKSVTLTWTPPADDGGCRVGNYVVEYYRSGWDVWLKATTSRRPGATLFDLIEGSEYRFRVKAESPYGMSEPSEESAPVRIPGESVDSHFLAVESRIISEVLRKEDGEDAPVPPPLVSPRRKKTEVRDTLAEVRRPAEPASTVTGRRAVSRSTDTGRPVESRSTDTGKRVETRTSGGMGQRVSSTEFMLVLCPDQEKSNEDKRKSFQLELEEALSPPPISFSSPELNTRVNPFPPLRHAVSSTELLHERAMDRFYQAVAIEQANNNRTEKPKRNAREPDRYQPQEREVREYTLDESDNGWKSQEERNDKRKVQEDRSKSPEPQEESIDKWKANEEPRSRHALILPNAPTISVAAKETTPPRLLERVESESSGLLQEPTPRWNSGSFDDDYTASTVSTEGSEEETHTDGSLEDFDRLEQIHEDEETYNPRDKMMRSPSPAGDERAVELLSKPAPLPDPNFVPKPILKKRENEQPETPISDKKLVNLDKPVKSDKMVKPEKMPGQLTKKSEKLGIFKKITKMPEMPKMPKGFGFSKKETKKEMDKLNEKLENVESNKVNSIEKKKSSITEDNEGGRILIEHYGNILKEFGNNKKPHKPLYLNTDELKKVADEQEREQITQKVSTKPKQTTKKKVKSTTQSNAITPNKVPNSIPKKKPTQKKESESKNVSTPRRIAATKKVAISEDKQEDKQTEKQTFQQVVLKTAARASIVIPIDYEQLEQQAKVSVRTAIDYTVDLCLLLLAFWFYFFKDERLSIPLVGLLIYRQVHQILFRNIPGWVDRHTPAWIKKKTS